MPKMCVFVVLLPKKRCDGSQIPAGALQPQIVKAKSLNDKEIWLLSSSASG